jgi:enamine deaminase RidA (YjgF/YER057c/UK114 family)
VTHHDPTDMVPSDAGFSHAVETPAGARWLHTTGQAGWRIDGSIPDDPDAQCAEAFANIGRLLGSAGMTAGDLVKLTAYLSGPEVVEPYRVARDAFLAGARPASTVLIVAAFALPGMVVEIEAIAAASPASPR